MAQYLLLPVLLLAFELVEIPTAGKIVTFVVVAARVGVLPPEGSTVAFVIMGAVVVVVVVVMVAETEGYRSIPDVLHLLSHYCYYYFIL